VVAAHRPPSQALWLIFLGQGGKGGGKNTPGGLAKEECFLVEEVFKDGNNSEEVTARYRAGG
jgi:hypothetical protein